ncbi:MAG: creatininase family protein [Gemmatimonadales bacterium]|nr:MAG: creatininase family protein [Gemmatimonadales bacterium]
MSGVGAGGDAVGGVQIHRSSPGPGRRWDLLSLQQRERASAGDPVVVLPLAATEQHGPHLPLSTDVDIGEGILGRALHALDPGDPAYRLPMRSVGASLEHEEWPGTLSRSAHELEEEVVAVGRDLVAQGVRRLLLFNSHGGNKAVLDTAALRLRVDHRMLVVKANYFRFPRPEGLDLPEEEWIHGLHGGAVETAMMLYLHPDRVRVAEIRPFHSLGEVLARTLSFVAPEGIAPFAWTARDLNPAGVTGDASRATAEMGRALVHHYARILAAILEDTSRFPLDALADRDL